MRFTATNDQRCTAASNTARKQSHRTRTAHSHWLSTVNQLGIVLGISEHFIDVCRIIIIALQDAITRIFDWDRIANIIACQSRDAVCVQHHHHKQQYVSASYHPSTNILGIGIQKYKLIQHLLIYRKNIPSQKFI